MDYFILQLTIKETMNFVIFWFFWGCNNVATFSFSFALFDKKFMTKVNNNVCNRMRTLVEPCPYLLPNLNNSVYNRMRTLVEPFPNRLPNLQIMVYVFSTEMTLVLELVVPFLFCIDLHTCWCENVTCDEAPFRFAQEVCFLVIICSVSFLFSLLCYWNLARSLL